MLGGAVVILDRHVVADGHELGDHGRLLVGAQGRHLVAGALGGHGRRLVDGELPFAVLALDGDRISRHGRHLAGGRQRLAGIGLVLRKARRSEQ